MADEITWIKTRVGDELGLTDTDLATLYGIDIKLLDDHLAMLADNPASIYDRILSDVDAVRVGYRQVEVTDESIQLIRDLLAGYPFHPLVSLIMADGSTGWRLSSDDAQWVAFRASDVVGLDFEYGEIVRLRLNRLVIWPETNVPDFDQAFKDRVADVTFYLLELAGVL